MPLPPLFALLLSLLASAAGAHEVDLSLNQTPTTLLTFTFSDGSPFSGKRVEVFRAGESEPFQRGTTDPHGNFAFLPDRDGTWRVRVVSEDGHGAEAEVAVKAGEQPVIRYSGLSAGMKIAGGAALLLGLGGVGLLMVRRRGRDQG